MIKGKVHSIQSLGTLDGPGVRFVVFMQGCGLRCKCCHNPDTWNIEEGTLYTPNEIVEKALKFREYFGEKGGITLSGGEPLLQAEFAYEVFKLCHEAGVNTCLDTAGSVFNENVEKLLSVTDRVLLDIKYTDEELYLENVGCDMARVLDFLAYLDKNHIATTVRQVIILTVNDTTENILKLKSVVERHSCVDKVELLPFRKICQTKYDNMGIKFPFGEIPEPKRDEMAALEKIIH